MMNLKKIKLHKNVTTSDIEILDSMCISVTEDDYVNEENKRIFEYHAHCNSDKEKELVNKLNHDISSRKEL